MAGQVRLRIDAMAGQAPDKPGSATFRQARGLRPFGRLVVFVMLVMDPALGGAHNVLKVDVINKIPKYLYPISRSAVRGRIYNLDKQSKYDMIYF